MIKVKFQTSIADTAGIHVRIVRKASVVKEGYKQKDNAIIGSTLGLSHGLVGLRKVRAGKLTYSSFGLLMAMSIESVAIYLTGMYKMALKPT